MNPTGGSALPSGLGPYEIVGELGRGGMGVVYRARRPQLGREFAIKVIKAGAGASPNTVARFVREAKAAAKLDDHPGIVGVHDVGRDGETLWFAMDLVDGPSFAQRIDEGDLPHRDAARLVAEAARAVHHAHRNGILHRDLKPGNLLVTKDGQVRVTDFGLAAELDPASEDPRLTATGARLGTPAYMSPEQARGMELDARSDVWALGATLYEALTGRQPFTGPASFEVLQAIVADDPTPPTQVDPTIPAGLVLVIGKCLEKEPERRYATAAALAEDLERWLGGEEVTATAPSMGRRLRRWIGRNRLLATAVGAAAVAGIAAGVWFLPQLSSAEQRAAQAESDVEAERQRTLDGLKLVAEASLEAALAMRRTGRNAEMQPYLDRLKAACAEVSRNLPDAPEPHFHLGRMHRALLDDDAALREVSASLQRDPAYAPALYERVVLRLIELRGRLHAAETAHRRNHGGLLSGEPGASLAPGALRADVWASDPALDALQEELHRELLGVQHAADAGAVPDALRHDCLRALVTYSGRSYEQATQLLEAVLKRAPERTEVWAAYIDCARRLKDPKLAVQRATDAIALDRGYAPFYVSRADALMRFPMPDPKAVRRARADYAEAARLGHRPADMHLAVANCDITLWLQADIRQAGEAGMLDAAAQALGEAARAGLDAGRLAQTQADLAVVRAKHAQRSGAATAELLTEAREGMARARELRPSDAKLAVEHALVLLEAGMVVEKAGGDPLPDRRAALAAAEQAVELDPAMPDAWACRGDAHGILAVSHPANHPAALPHFEQADADLSRAVQLVRDSDVSWLFKLGMYRYNHGVQFFNVRKDEPARRLFGAAEAALQRATSLSPDWWAPWAYRGLNSARLGGCLPEAGARVQAFQDGVAYLTRALELPGCGPHWLTKRAGAHYEFGRALNSMGRAAEAEYRAAIADATKALEHDDMDGRALYWRLSARRSLGMAAGRAGKDALPFFERAVEDTAKLLKSSPHWRDAWREAGHAWMMVAEEYVYRRQPEKAKAPSEEALRILDQAIALAPRDAFNYETRGRVHANASGLLKRHGGSVREGARLALEDLRQAARLDPAAARRSKRTIAALEQELARPR